MPSKTSHIPSSAIPPGFDTFQSLANIYLASAERLLVLNLTAMRSAVEAGATATASLAAMKDGSGASKQQAAFTPQMLEKSMAYTRSTFEILSATQQEVAEALTSQFKDLGSNLRLPTDWNAPFELFAKSAQQFSTLATKSAAANTEAGTKALTETLSKLRRAA